MQHAEWSSTTPQPLAKCIFHKACTAATKCWQFYSLYCNFSSNFIFNSVLNFIFLSAPLFFGIAYLPRAGLGRAEQGRPGSFGVAQRRSRSSKSSKSRGLFGAAACSGGKVNEGERGEGAVAGAHLDGFTFGREACFDTGELNTIVQYLFNVNEKRQTRQDKRGTEWKAGAGGPVQYSFTLIYSRL